MLLFAARWPVLVDPDTGMPRRWRQFMVGLQVAARIDARDTIRAAGAARAASGTTMTDEARKQWDRQQERLAGW